MKNAMDIEKYLLKYYPNKLTFLYALKENIYKMNKILIRWIYLKFI